MFENDRETLWSVSILSVDYVRLPVLHNIEIEYMHITGEILSIESQEYQIKTIFECSNITPREWK